MKVLVTGGAGFIGSNFILYLLAEEPQAEIVNLDALTYAGNLENLAGVDQDPRYQFVKADVSNTQEVMDVFENHRPELVINFAAESHVDRSILDSAAFVRTNVLGTQVLLEAARKFEVRMFCQVSTDEVYGSLGPDDPPFREQTPMAPNSPYAASKAGADLLVRSYFRTHGLKAVLTRCSNNYGPYQFPEKFIPLFTTNLLDDKPCPIYGDGSNVRDWIHVADHCSGVWAAVTRGKSGEVYNFGGDNEWPNIEIARKLLAILDKPDSLLTFVKDRPGHDWRYAIDSTKAQNDLDWSPSVSFEEGLRQTVEWYRSNTEWWQRIKSGDYRDFYRLQYGGQS